MASDWMLTSTGKKFYPLRPRVEDVCVEDIARGLAMTCRFGGQTSRCYYSVAEHCVLVSRHCDPEYAREALLHDAAEAYIGDMIRPLKHQPQMVEFCRAEDRVEAVIAEKFKLRRDPAALAAVKDADDRILVDEVRALMRGMEQYIEPGSLLAKLWDRPLGVEILGYSPERAEVLFLARFGELFPEFVDPRALRVRADMEIL